MSRIETPRPIRGTQDIFGAEAEAFAHVVETFERVRKLYRFRRIEMPVFEKTEVFSRSLGETTDVVSKEMYSFLDRGEESLTLRPEFTAGIARAYLTDGWQQYAPLKVATHGPLFRYERPQKGRYRQFHQLDAEIIGASEPQGQRFAAAVVERVHLLRNHVGRLAERAGEHLGLLEHRHLDAAETVELAHALEGLNDMRERLGLGAEDVLCAADGARGFDLAHAGAALSGFSRGSQSSP